MTIAKILERAVRGERLEREEIEQLFAHGDLLSLGQAADAVRRRKTDQGVASYIIDRNINYTNVCIYRCRFCAFYRTKEANDAYVLPFSEIADKVAETIASGGTGILLQGGVHPDLRMEFYEDLLRQLKTGFPDIHLHAFSVPEIWFLAKLPPSAQ